MGIIAALLAGFDLVEGLGSLNFEGFYIALLAGPFLVKVQGVGIILFPGLALVGVCLFAPKLFPLRC